MSEKKITENQLKKLNEFEESLARGNNIVGSITIQYEFQKANLLSQVKDLNEQYTKFKMDLKEEYGDIDIDISTGEYSEKETNDKPS